MDIVGNEIKLNEAFLINTEEKNIMKKIDGQYSRILF
jgi:hypothetical protein